MDLLNAKDEKLTSQFSSFNETISPSQQKMPGVESISPSSNEIESPKCDMDSIAEQNFKQDFSETSSTSIDLSTLAATAEAILVKIIRRAVSIQAFRSMSRSDQLILISENWSSIFLLHATFAGRFCESVFNMVSVSQ